MATFDIVIDDLKVRINHTNNNDQRSFPRTGYRFEKRNDKILLIEAGTGQIAFRIDAASELNSITDNRTVAGATTPISTIQEIFDILDATATPFFFRESVGGGGGIVGPETFIEYSGDTTDGSVTEIFVEGVNLSRTLVPTDTQIAFELFITGKQTGGIAGTVGDSATFKVEGEIKNIGDVVTINNNTTTTISQYVPTENWEVQVRANDTEDAIRINVVGETDKNISWKGELRTINL